jgi:hypothetical protein
VQWQALAISLANKVIGHAAEFIQLAAGFILQYNVSMPPRY